MFELGKLYKHCNNTDVAFKYLGLVGKYETGISIIISWWNIVHEPRLIRREAVIHVSNNQLINWKEFQPEVTCGGF
jgi:hypothetical protein